LQSVLATCRYVLLVNINESHVVPGAREASTDDTTDRACSNNDHAHDDLTSSLDVVETRQT
jgi:hypothetical protein